MTPEQIALADEVLTQIDLHPETWTQEQWRNDCGAGGCFCGWLVEVDPEASWTVTETPGSGLAAFNVQWQGLTLPVWEYGRSRLGLDDDQADLLFDSKNDRQSLEWALDAIRGDAEILHPALQD